MKDYELPIYSDDETHRELEDVYGIAWPSEDELNADNEHQQTT